MWSLWDRILWAKEMWSCILELTFWFLIPFVICKMLYLRIIKKEKVRFNIQTIENTLKELRWEIFSIPLAFSGILSIVVILDYFRCQMIMYGLVKILKFKILIDVIMNKVL